MATSKFTPYNQAAIVHHLRRGGSMAEICRDLAVREKTAEGWLTRGRREDAGDYADFAGRVEQARAEADQESLEELDVVKLLEKAARNGSIQAMTKLLDRFERKRKEMGGQTELPLDGNPFEDLGGDELAAARRRRA